MTDVIDIHNVAKLTTIPTHVAFILDGNRRWAKENRLTLNKGHKIGAKNIENLCNWCIKYKIPYLSLYCLSIENLKRSRQELKYLFSTIEKFLSPKQISEYQHRGIKIKIIGDNSCLPQFIATTIENANKLSRQFNNDIKLNVQLCIGYSGRNEIVNATKQMILDNIQPSCIDEKKIEQYLYSKDFPDVDLLIRTGGDERISNFLLWKLSYAELYFCKVYFPAFQEKDFLLALYDFNNRLRRYGG